MDFLRAATMTCPRSTPVTVRLYENLFADARPEEFPGEVWGPKGQPAVGSEGLRLDPGIRMN